MDAWTKKRAGYRKGLCGLCHKAEAVALCDGVLRGKVPWSLCNMPMCQACRTTGPGKVDYCPTCAAVPGR